jgi:hypothetical protein
LLVSFDSVYRASVNASSAVGAVIGVDNPLVAFLGDSAERTGVVAGTTVDALVINVIGHGVHLLYSGIRSMVF